MLDCRRGQINRSFGIEQRVGLPINCVIRLMCADCSAELLRRDDAIELVRLEFTLGLLFKIFVMIMLLLQAPGS